MSLNSTNLCLIFRTRFPFQDLTTPSGWLTGSPSSFSTFRSTSQWNNFRRWARRFKIDSRSLENWEKVFFQNGEMCAHRDRIIGMLRSIPEGTRMLEIYRYELYATTKIPIITIVSLSKTKKRRRKKSDTYLLEKMSQEPSKIST